MSWKKYLPPKHLIPAIAIIGGVGGVILAVAFPKAMAWIAAKIPTIQKQ